MLSNDLKRKNLIFDFDGTLADSLDLAIKLYNEIHHLYACPFFDSKNKETLRNLSIPELLKEYKISTAKALFLVFKVKKRLKSRLGDLKFFSGIKDLLIDLESKNFSLYVLSSNSQSNLMTVLKREGVLSLFKAVYGGASVFSKDKKIKKLLKKEGLKIEESLYIGDELRDIKACQKISLPIISLSWGFNSREILEKSNPGMVVDSVEYLLEKLLKKC